MEIPQAVLRLGRILELVNALGRGLYAAGLRRSRRASLPVVSVGNIALGGTGKTPLVAALAAALQRAGARPAILTRGYRRRDKRPQLVLDGAALDWEGIGDEPALLARLLPGVPIVVDADRVRGAATAARETSATHLLLDDGFQHWRLARDLDIVLLDADDPLCERRPRREGPGALARADVAVAVDADADALAEARATVCAHAPGLRIVDCELRATAVHHGGQERPVEWLRGRRVVAFAGIAAPWRFVDTLAGIAAEVVEERFFPDHHAVNAGELEAIVRRADELDAVAVTTGKDAVKLGAGDLARVAWLGVELAPRRGELAEVLTPVLAPSGARIAP